MAAPTRPLLRWHGGKWRLAPRIIAHFPPHRVYVEPFGGAGSVLLRKRRSYAEVYNDLDGEVVNLFRVLRSHRAAELIAALRLTPFARDEFKEAYEPSDDPVERARCLAIRSFMGFGSDGHNIEQPTGFRANSNRSYTTAAHDWINYPEALRLTISRLRGVVVENRDALEVMRQHDGPETLHYVDPPYLPSTRSMNYRKGPGYHNYQHEMDEEAHVALLEDLREVRGAVVLSGYPNPLYDQSLLGWRRIEMDALADGARPRVEMLWLNPVAQRGLPQGHLFEWAP